ncbi:MAG: hypothetical protein A2498_05330 [Lentisphaerae bacterium RIFOXYC12_FULL_60_16]|nr:MAG: hypothetical protein A2498_05330 [Lentisphaerae bacterium RIFOXYC12_FULL_60_16]OGV86269.1 MAG: hypothetical protein A2340_01525 [Lentisphaerae bacterium RIFOXYB12_FULL_60_10]
MDPAVPVFKSQALRPWQVTGSLACWGTAFILSCWLSMTNLHPDQPPASATHQVVGQARFAIGLQFYQTADRYFHRGIGPVRQSGLQHSWYHRTLEAITPKGHLHRSGDSIGEMLPWLELAIRMDPRNVEIYLVSAFWLAGECRRPDLALALLLQGQAANPWDYRFQLEQGRLHLHQQHQDDAIRHLDAALAFWPHPFTTRDEQAHYDRATMLLFRGILHELHHDIPAAIRSYRAMLTLFPDRSGIRARLEALDSNSALEHLAGDYLHDTLQHDEQVRNQLPCEHGEHSGEHDVHDEDIPAGHSTHTH